MLLFQTPLWGNFFARRGGCGLGTLPQKLQQAPPPAQSFAGNTRMPRLCGPAPKAGAVLSSSARFFTAFFPQFRRGFPAVMTMAKRLQILTVRKTLPIALVVYDVIYISCQCSSALSCTHNAPRMLQELRGSKIFRPYVRGIPAMPDSCFRASIPLWSMQ